MKWLTLINKIGKQSLKSMSKAEVIVIIEGKEYKITGLKFKTDGSPYMIAE